MKRSFKMAAALAAITMAFAGSPAMAGTLSSSMPSSSTFGDGRPWWDPTQVIESPVDPNHAEGTINTVVFTDDADGDHVINPKTQINDGTGPRYGRVQIHATGFTPGLYYTMRVVLREAGTGDDWGVYTWLTYQATDAGEINGNLRLAIPTRAKQGERVVAVPTIYNANDVRRDGRPNKVDSKCVLQCERVAPLAAWTDYNAEDAIVTIGAPA